MSMFPIVRFVVAALLLTGTTTALVPKLNNTTATTPTTPTAITATAETSAQLSAEEALSIALAHAGLTREDVTKVHTRLERDDGILHWDVEFRSDTHAYDYEIHTETGIILDHDRDRLRTATQPTTPPTEAPVPTEPVPTELTQEEALTIALAHAGLTREEVTRIQVERDRDNGVWTYEIEFRVGQMEYGYEIHTETGEILEWEKELDD